MFCAGRVPASGGHSTGAVEVSPEVREKGASKIPFYTPKNEPHQMCNGLAIGYSCLAVSLDLGSLIAGIVAVGAALWAARSAYSSAMKQVEATAKATNDQINALRAQEDRQAENVREAVQIEITSMVTGVLNLASLLGPLRKGGQTLLPQTREIIARSLITPTIYPAIADRVGLLRDPYPVVIFYSKVATARSFITSSWLDEMGTPPDFLGLTLVTLQEALLLARPIVAGEIFGGRRLDDARRKHTTSEIDACLRDIFGIDPKAAPSEP
jgi:hypothetical protein